MAAKKDTVKKIDAQSDAKHRLPSGGLARRIIDKLPPIKKTQADAAPKKLRSSFALLMNSFALYKGHLKVLGGLTLIYLIARLLIGGLPSFEMYDDIKSVISTNFEGSFSRLLTGMTVIGGALSGSFTPTYDALQQTLVTLFGIGLWLALVWSLRQIMADNTVTVRLALYNSMTPLVPLLIIIFILLLELIPGAFGLMLLTYAIASPFNGIVTVLMVGAAILLFSLTLFFIIQSLLAAIIVTLPNTYPVASLKSSRLLVKNKSAQILAKIFMLGLFILILWIATLLPFLLLESAAGGRVSLVPLVAEILTAFSLAISTVYLYLLYRELL